MGILVHYGEKVRENLITNCSTPENGSFHMIHACAQNGHGSESTHLYFTNIDTVIANTINKLWTPWNPPNLYS